MAGLKLMEGLFLATLRSPFLAGVFFLPVRCLQEHELILESITTVRSNPISPLRRRWIPYQP